MPSPIAHLGAGYVIYRLSERYAPELGQRRIGPFPVTLIASVAFSMAPDIDSVAGVLTGQFARFHNNMTHSFSMALFTSLIFAAAVRLKWQSSFRFWWLLSLTGYALHIVMDAAAVSRGVMAFWPFSTDRYLFPVTIFYGFHWSDGLVSARHIITVLTEAAFVGAIVWLSRLIVRRIQYARA
jgi:inner membrane protein